MRSNWHRPTLIGVVFRSWPRVFLRRRERDPLPDRCSDATRTHHLSMQMLSRADSRSNCVSDVKLIAVAGGGLWHPEAAPTHAMRRAIDRHPRRLKDVLLNDRIRQEFLAGASKSDMAVVKAFTKSNAENALKTRPKGESHYFRPSSASTLRAEIARRGCSYGIRACGGSSVAFRR